MSLPLDQPLPVGAHRGPWGITAYHSYPAFSSVWLAKRTATIGTIAGVFGTFILLTSWLSTRSLASAAIVAGSFALGGLLMATTGPAFATLVRHRRWSRRREARGVVIALLVGVVISFGVDTAASAVVDIYLPPPPPPAPPGEPPPTAIAINVVLLLLIYGLLGGGVALRTYLREPAIAAAAERERELASLRARQRDLDAQLALLQAQIEPHFLFNTLASVRSLVTTDPAAATRAIDGLVDYLRATIPRLRGAGADSTLGQQLEICASYLEVMAVRTGRLAVAIDASPDLRALPFPPLLLMSLVENAIKHGIEPRRGPGRVALSARRDRGALIVSVVDDGAGLPEVPGSGVGLANVRAQLRARHGDGARLELTSGPAGGTAATITIPLEAP